MTVIHRPGKKHGNADPLSRIPDNKPCPDMKVDIDPTQLPCGGCKYCTRAHKNWGKFTEDVDDVVPLGRTVETTEVHAALSWLFNEKESHDMEFVFQESSSDLHHTSLEISFTDPDKPTVISMEEQQCNKVCTASRTRGFAGIEYSPAQLKECQEKDSDLRLILPYLVSNETPSEDEIFISSKAAKKYWVNKEMVREYYATAQRMVENQDLWCQKPW